MIMDGNGRWARQRSQLRVFGHKKGAARVRDIVTMSCELGIEALTLYAFSDENWGRPATEVAMIMKLLGQYLNKQREELRQNNVRFQVIGDISRVPDGVRKVIQETTRYLAENTGLTLTLAVSYGGRAELVRATREIAAMAAEGSISLDQIDASLIEKNLYTAGLPEVDLVIRTSGELRVSNFLLWQIAYAELYFSPVFWPDFTTAVYADALIDYLRRRRRFGLTDDQIPSEPVTGLSPRISQELPPC
jgi:undecaprenyl diphosphate synthase